MEITCPKLGGSCDECPWAGIPGQVRDVMDCGLLECQECKLVTHSRSLANHVNYVEGSMHNWSGGYGDNLPKPSDDKLRRLNLLNKLIEQNNFSHPTILDFGCGNGEMLEIFQKYYETCGLEPDKGARELAKSRLDSRGWVFSDIDEAITSGTKFELITLFHVIEHFYDPDTELRNIGKVLKPGGLVVIETPNSQDALLTKYENSRFRTFTYWSHHPMLHSHKSLEIMMERNGYSVIENLGIQRYGLANHLYWLSEGRPGGHTIWDGFIGKNTDSHYETDLVAQQMNDTLWMVARIKD